MAKYKDRKEQRKVMETMDSFDLCKGVGYTDHKMKPKMVQDGWE